MQKLFEKFLKSDLGLEIWSDGKVVFCSKKPTIQGLSEFIEKYGQNYQDLIIFDKKVGNAVALLCAYLKAKEVYGILGSKMAEKTLMDSKIKFKFLKTISYIMNKKNDDICPMEKLSLKKTPEEFYMTMAQTRQFF